MTQRYTIEVPNWFPHVIIDVDAVFNTSIAVLGIIVAVKFICLAYDAYKND